MTEDSKYIECRCRKRDQKATARKYAVKGHLHIDTYPVDGETVLMVFRRAEKTTEAAGNGREE